MNVNKNLIDYSYVSKKSLTRFSLDKKQKKKKNEYITRYEYDI